MDVVEGLEMRGESVLRGALYLEIRWRQRFAQPLEALFVAQIDAMLQRPHADTAVEKTGVEVGEVERGRDLFGQCTLAGCSRSIHGDYDFWGWRMEEPVRHYIKLDIYNMWGGCVGITRVSAGVPAVWHG